jgi:hypothetical protein
MGREVRKVPAGWINPERETLDRRLHTRRAGDLTAIESALVADVARLRESNRELLEAGELMLSAFYRPGGYSTKELNEAARTLRAVLNSAGGATC